MGDINIFTVFYELLCKSWRENPDYTWWQAYLIGSFFFFCDCLFVITFTFMRKCVIVEYGYPKRKNKYIKRMMKDYSIWDHVSLFKLAKNAEQKGFIIVLTIIDHWLVLLAFVCSCIGFVGNIITVGKGWSLTLLLFPVFIMVIFTIVIEFIPHLLYLPSEHRRYKR